jgi:hypothetical protein
LKHVLEWVLGSNASMVKLDYQDTIILSCLEFFLVQYQHNNSHDYRNGNEV